MGILTWILLGVIVLVAIGLGVGVFFTGLLRGAEIVGENPTVQNATDEARDFIGDSADSVAGGALVALTTDSTDYNIGDPVLITVENNDDESLTFPDAALGLQVQNTETDREYSVMAAQVVTELGPGESKTITWQDESAPPGDYVASVRSSDGASAQVSFEITG